MKNPLFTDLAEEEIESARQCLSPSRRHYSSGELIALRGDPADGFGIIISGVVEICKDFYSGNHVVVMFLSEGDSFAEGAAVSSNAVYPVTVVAKTDCEVDFYYIQPILSMCSSACNVHKKIMTNLLRLISDRLWALQRRLDVISQKTLRGKITSFLLDMFAISHRKKLKLPFFKHEWASYLGVSRPSLSRELSWMRDEGLIDFSGREVEILDLTQLEKCLDPLE